MGRKVRTIMTPGSVSFNYKNDMWRMDERYEVQDED